MLLQDSLYSLKQILIQNCEFIWKTHEAVQQMKPHFNVTFVGEGFKLLTKIGMKEFIQAKNDFKCNTWFQNSY